MAKMMSVSAGTAPSTPVPRVAAEINNDDDHDHDHHYCHYCYHCHHENGVIVELVPSFWKAAGTSMVAGLMKVKKRTLAPS